MGSAIMEENNPAQFIAADLAAIKAQVSILARECSAYDLTALAFLLEMAITEANNIDPAIVSMTEFQASRTLQ